MYGLTSTAVLATLPVRGRAKQAHEQSDNTVFFEIMTALEVVMLATNVLIAFATICGTATYAAAGLPRASRAVTIGETVTPVSG